MSYSFTCGLHVSTSMISRSREFGRKNSRDATEHLRGTLAIDIALNWRMLLPFRRKIAEKPPRKWSCRFIAVFRINRKKVIKLGKMEERFSASGRISLFSENPKNVKKMLTGRKVRKSEYKSGREEGSSVFGKTAGSIAIAFHCNLYRALSN